MNEEGPRQLTLPLAGAPRFLPEDYLVAPANQEAYSFLAAWPQWPTRGLMLIGPSGSGKSHLATVWAARAGATVIQGSELSLDSVGSLGAGKCWAVENIDSSSVSETNLFHLLNAARERAVWLLLTASRSPERNWPILPDLASRLRALSQVRLTAPDQQLVRAVLVKLFDDRQLAVEAEVIDYIARRMERSLDAARSIVALLDEEALALGRRVTRPVAAKVLARLAPEEE